MSFLRLVGGFFCIAVLVSVMVPILVVLLPWRVARIRVTNAFGKIVGRNMVWWSGSRIKLEGLEHVRADRPAIYCANHTSTLDAFTTVWLTPAGTVGVAKKEVLYYPFYGQAWWLAGHLLLDRGRTDKAKAALRRTADFIRRKALHICILPEGKRSASGRLLPFKKGIVHVALETRLPVVPMVTIGLQNAWKRGSLSFTPVDAKIIFLPPIETTSWTEEKSDAHIDELRAAFLAVLPPDQHPEDEG